MESRYPTFEPPPTRPLENDEPSSEVRTPDLNRRPNVPLAMVAAGILSVGVLLGFTAMVVSSEILGDASFGGLFLSVLVLGTAVWRYDPGARIVLCSTVPFALVYVYWAVSRGGWDFPQVLLLVVPVAWASLSIILAAILLRRVGATTMVLGIVAGVLMMVYMLGNLVVAVSSLYLDDGLFRLLQAADVISCLSACAWFILLSVALARHARAQA